MRLEDGRSCKRAARDCIGDGSGDVTRMNRPDHARLDQGNQRFMYGKNGTRDDSQVTQAYARGFLQDHVHHMIAIAEMVTERQGRAVTHAAGLQRGVQIRDELAAVPLCQPRLDCAGTRRTGDIRIAVGAEVSKTLDIVEAVPAPTRSSWPFSAKIHTGSFWLMRFATVASSKA